MGVKEVNTRLRSISGRYHDDTNYSVKHIPPTDINDLFARLKRIAGQEDAKALEAALKEYFLLDSFCYVQDNGHHSRCFYANHAQPVIEALFINYPDKFLAIFKQVKDKPDLYNAFLRAVSVTDLQILEKEWTDKIVQNVNASLKELDDHGKKLSKEDAKTDAAHVSELSAQLKSILDSASPRRESHSDIKSSTPLLTKSPDLKTRIEFAATLHSKDQQLGNHRKFWKVVAGNILLGILGGGILYGLAIWCKKGKPYFFGDTDRQNKVEKIHTALDPERTLLSTPRI